jgi:membrane-associated phospholipid phosphatase
MRVADRKVWLFLALILFAEILSASGQTALRTPCSVGSATYNVGVDAKTLWHGIKSIPRNAIRPSNLAWELPIGAATGILIAEVDVPAANRIQSKSLQDVSGRWSNIGLGLELGASALGWTVGCAGHHSAAAEAGFTALTATAAVAVVNLGLKAAFNRQYPYGKYSSGEFWAGGKSFPSGHAATSFAFASTVAHRYPHNPWIKWGAYALASGVSLSRYPAKKHFPSDILMGATLGYVTGSYMADHTSHRDR